MGVEWRLVCTTQRTAEIKGSLAKCFNSDIFYF